MIWLLYLCAICAGLLLEPLAQSLPHWVPALLSALSVGFGGLTQNYRQGDYWDKHLHHWQFIATTLAALVVYVGWGTVLALSAAFLGDFIFQVGVNLDSGLPAVDRKEAPTYSLGKTAMRKPFYGRGRYIQAAAAAALMVLHTHITSTLLGILP